MLTLSVIILLAPLFPFLDATSSQHSSQPTSQSARIVFNYVSESLPGWRRKPLIKRWPSTCTNKRAPHRVCYPLRTYNDSLSTMMPLTNPLSSQLLPFRYLQTATYN